MKRILSDTGIGKLPAINDTINADQLDTGDSKQIPTQLSRCCKTAFHAIFYAYHLPAA